ncbi:hypothetical protein WJX74_009289 [Apatococcus lobatus]|uniref:Uncharacterized protein n=2 Tax=Apatococcus TaxID=904362 RepID=A0AAW1SUS2_9CHLO
MSAGGFADCVERKAPLQRRSGPPDWSLFQRLTADFSAVSSQYNGKLGPQEFLERVGGSNGDAMGASPPASALVDKVLQSYTRTAGKPFGGSAAEYDNLQQYVAKQSGASSPPREALEKIVGWKLEGKF